MAQLLNLNACQHHHLSTLNCCRLPTSWCDISRLSRCRSAHQSIDTFFYTILYIFYFFLSKVQNVCRVAGNFYFLCCVHSHLISSDVCVTWIFIFPRTERDAQPSDQCKMCENWRLHVGIWHRHMHIRFSWFDALCRYYTQIFAHNREQRVPFTCNALCDREYNLIWNRLRLWEFMCDCACLLNAATCSLPSQNKILHEYIFFCFAPSQILNGRVRAEDSEKENQKTS